MLYLLFVFMLISGFYTLTYGITLYVEDENTLGAGAVIAVAVIGTFLPIFVLLMN